MIIDIRLNRTTDMRRSEVWRAQMSAALDRVWQEGWLRDSLMHRDSAACGELRDLAETIKADTDCVIITAPAQAARSLRAALDLNAASGLNAVSGQAPHYAGAASGIDGGSAPGNYDAGGAAPELIVTGDTLSTGAFSRVIRRAEGRRTALIAVSAGSEDPAYRAAFSTYRDFVFANDRRLGRPRAVPVAAICAGRSSQSFGRAAENGYRIIEMPEGCDPRYIANTPSVLLPLMVAGADAGRYLGGFRETICAPEWDGRAVLAADMLASCRGTAEIEYWQEEFAGLAAWTAAGVSAGQAGPAGRLIRRRPAELPGAGPGDLRLLLYAEEGYSEVMTPAFEGCDPDGSLTRLALSEIDRDFFSLPGREAAAGVAVAVKRTDAASAGALMAFMQITDMVLKYADRAC